MELHADVGSVDVADAHHNARFVGGVSRLDQVGRQVRSLDRQRVVSADFEGVDDPLEEPLAVVLDR